MVRHVQNLNEVYSGSKHIHSQRNTTISIIGKGSKVSGHVQKLKEVYPRNKHAHSQSSRDNFDGAGPKVFGHVQKLKVVDSRNKHVHSQSKRDNFDCWCRVRKYLDMFRSTLILKVNATISIIGVAFESVWTCSSSQQTRQFPSL